MTCTAFAPLLFKSMYHILETCNLYLTFLTKVEYKNYFCTLRDNYFEAIKIDQLYIYTFY